ncbi:unnamed protein product [Schistocephalus solidus]|uniref:Protein lifeguard 1 n=1 Tax=Schistocephalus solidus TaxID=70667 RepID=A0A183SG49_SCHSO|nr:unnamed protein product [Schistocephalus solidus]
MIGWFAAPFWYDAKWRAHPRPHPPLVYRPYSPPGEYQATTGPANDSDDFAASGFDDKTIRRKFISKVYAILTVQLLVTMAFVCVFLFVNHPRKPFLSEVSCFRGGRCDIPFLLGADIHSVVFRPSWIKRLTRKPLISTPTMQVHVDLVAHQNEASLTVFFTCLLHSIILFFVLSLQSTGEILGSTQYVVLLDVLVSSSNTLSNPSPAPSAVFLVTYITLACCPSIRRRVPGNYIALAVFTLAFSYLAGTITSAYSVNSVLICLIVTASVTLTVSVAAIACPCDITKCQAMLAFLSILLIIFGLVCTIVYFAAGYNSVLHAVYGGVAAIIFSIYLAYDTQMVIGGRRYELSPEDYIFGALQLYVDVVQLFLSLLSLFGSHN